MTCSTPLAAASLPPHFPDCRHATRRDCSVRPAPPGDHPNRRRAGRFTCPAAPPDSRSCRFDVTRDMDFAGVIAPPPIAPNLDQCRDRARHARPPRQRHALRSMLGRARGRRRASRGAGRRVYGVRSPAFFVKAWSLAHRPSRWLSPGCRAIEVGGFTLLDSILPPPRLAGAVSVSRADYFALWSASRVGAGAGSGPRRRRRGRVRTPDPPRPPRRAAPVPALDVARGYRRAGASGRRIFSRSSLWRRRTDARHVERRRFLVSHPRTPAAAPVGSSTSILTNSPARFVSHGSVVRRRASGPRSLTRTDWRPQACRDEPLRLLSRQARRPVRPSAYPGPGPAACVRWRLWSFRRCSRFWTRDRSRPRRCRRDHKAAANARSVGRPC